MKFITFPVKKLLINSNFSFFQNIIIKPQHKTREKVMTGKESIQFLLFFQVRWVVEAANARLKCWKYLCHILPTNQVPFIGDYVRIVCSLCNKYLPAINATKESDEMIASQMLDRLSRSNELQSYVESNNLERRNISKWSNVEDCNLSDFPVLNETILRVLTLGTYQLKLSTSYIQEYIGGDCNFQLYNEAPDLLRVRLQSRHVSSKSYLVWIKYDSDHVKAWYCKCKAGARTVGTCSHVAAVLWYLGLAIHMDKNRYGVQDWGRFLEDAADIPQSVDVSDSEESTVEE